MEVVGNKGFWDNLKSTKKYALNKLNKNFTKIPSVSPQTQTFPNRQTQRIKYFRVNFS